MIVKLDRVWDVLGPFPIHAREQHFLSPAYPLDLSLPIDTTLQYPSSLTHPASVSWSQTTADPHGTIHVSHPAVPWHQMRATEGWAGLQHLNVLRGWLSVLPPTDPNENPSEPLLHTKLLQAAFFTILPPPDAPERQTHVPQWHNGNIYSLEKAPVQLITLPLSPAIDRETRYEVIICAPYEIRLFGDPSAYSSPHPILKLNFSIFPLSLKTDDPPLQHILAHSVTPHIVDGTPFGDAVGIGVQSLDLGHCWSIVRACLIPISISLPPSLSVSLLDDVSMCIAPTQTRIIPIRLSSPERLSQDINQLDLELTCVRASRCVPDNTEPARVFILRATIPLTHVSHWTQEKHVAIRASYFFAKSMPTLFVVKAPQEALGDVKASSCQYMRKGKGNEPILALHGAGVDILAQPFWADSLPRQKYAWIVMPRGRTSWGLDWHGPSTADAFAAVSALSSILSDAGAARWAEWGFDADTRVILMGHSNGGQGAWYMASRWPDRVCAVVPAAGYIKSQAYVSWSMSRFAHFIDPALRAVLDSSLTPDDDDLFLGNLVGKPVLALHGGADDNVPPWHTREQVGILKTWDPETDVTYHEDPGKPHWYPEVLSNKRVQDFLDRVYFPPSSSFGTKPRASQDHARTFTLTVAIPAESGPLNGWRVHALASPGLLGRLRVTIGPDGQVSARTTNVLMFSLDPVVFCATRDDVNELKLSMVDGDLITPLRLRELTHTILWAKNGTTRSPHRHRQWKDFFLNEPVETVSQRLRTPRQRLQSILSTNAPLTLLVPSLAPSPELSAALRIAHALQLFHALDAQIVGIAEVETTSSLLEGNMVVIGCAETPLVHKWLESAGNTWTYTDGAWCLDTVRFDRPSSAILFCQPHPYDVRSVALFLQSTDVQGLERAVRLFPIRTGVLSPDWLVVDGRADTIGAAGVQGAGVYGWSPLNLDDQRTMGNWVWSERVSWLD